MGAKQEGAIGVSLVLVWCMVAMFLWAFAFFHLPGATPEWLLRAQSACFGTTETGLPDTYGWMLLVLAPLSLLFGMFVALQREIVSGVKAFLIPAWGRGALVFLIALLIVEGIWVGGRISAGLKIANADFSSEEKLAFPETYPRSDRIAPDFSLVDQHGDTVTLAQFKGTPVILTFAFAHCRTVCPMVIKNATKARTITAQEAVLLIVTLDPWRDTPGSLPSLATEWKLGKNEYILSGNVTEVEETLNKYQMLNAPNPKNGDIVHPALTYIIDSKGSIAYTLNGANAEWISAALKLADQEKSNA